MKIVAVLFFGAVLGYYAQNLVRRSFAQQGPEAVVGCVYFSAAPTLTDKQENVLLCDVNGKLLVH